MTTAISSYTQPVSQLSACSWIDGICQKIYDLAMKLFKTVSDFFIPKSNPLSETTTKTMQAANIITFYRNASPNNNQVTLAQILNWNDDQLEQVHNYIQWLFPLEQPSGPNPTAPVLDTATIQVFRQDVQLRAVVLGSFRRMLTFYGLQIDDAARTITRAPNFAARAMVWLTPPDHNYHNYLRITRIIHSLCLLGLPEYGRSFLAIMEDVARNEGVATVNPATLQFWRGAII